MTEVEKTPVDHRGFQQLACCFFLVERETVGAHMARGEHRGPHVVERGNGVNMAERGDSRG